MLWVRRRSTWVVKKLPSTFTDMKLTVITALTASGGMTAATRTPNDLVGSMPFVRIQRVGGSDDWWTDHAYIDIETFCADEQASSDLSESIRQFVHRMSGHEYFGRLVDHVETSIAPIWVDYGNPNVQRYTATYIFDSRITA